MRLQLIVETGQKTYKNNQDCPRCNVASYAGPKIKFEIQNVVGVCGRGRSRAGNVIVVIGLVVAATSTVVATLGQAATVGHLENEVNVIPLPYGNCSCSCDTTTLRK